MTDITDLKYEQETMRQLKWKTHELKVRLKEMTTRYEHFEKLAAKLEGRISNAQGNLKRHIEREARLLERIEELENAGNLARD